jgi:S1-C subfamily serine protease
MRFNAGPEVIRWAALIAGAIGSAGLWADTAQAQNWQSLGNDNKNNSWWIDGSSINNNGSSSWAWVRETYSTTQFESGSGAEYTTSITRWLFDCQRQQATMESETDLNQSGSVVYAQTTPPNAEQSTTMGAVPGTVGAVLLKAACQSAGAPASANSASPQLSIGPDDATWRQVGDGEGVRDFVSMKQASRKGDDDVYFFSKEVFDAPQKLPDGGLYYQILGIEGVKCQEKTFTFQAGDFYDQRGSLVSAQPLGTPSFDPIKPGTFADDDWKFVCKGVTVYGEGQGSSSTTGGVQLQSGTAWLVPKGYLITANHVVEGATALFIMQGGQSAGTAEVVATDPANDVAVLKPNFIDNRPKIAIDLSAEPPLLGERVFTLGTRRRIRWASP